MDSLEKRTLIAVILALVVLIASQYFYSLFSPPQQSPPPQEKQEKEAVRKEVQQKETVTEVKSAAVPTTTADYRETKVETDLYQATISSRGGTIAGFRLKKYKDKNGISVSLIGDSDAYPALGIGSDSQAIIFSQQPNFSIRGKDLLLKGNEKGSIIFEYTSPQLSVRRTYTFYGNTYRIDVTEEVTGPSDYWVTLGSSFGYHDPNDSTAPHIGPVLLKDTDRMEFTAKKMKEPKVFSEKIKWIAQEDKYFFSSIIPPQNLTEVKIWKDKNSIISAVRLKSGVNAYSVYAGPKEYDTLKELKADLEHIIDFGFFSILARPLFWILKFFYRFMGNYGWAIVLLTIITRLPFIPIINKGQKAMKRLQEIQPRINELREKYKNDPQRLQKEMMEIYKKYKVNPMGGCLPILLQIPVFFALYKVLLIAIELRGAPFIFWIKDLSMKDPYYILPIIMGATMVIQQKMTPSSLDPRQNKIMMFMPVIFTFLFLNFASGLVLYWLVNNILSIGQQVYINRRSK